MLRPGLSNGVRLRLLTALAPGQRCQCRRAGPAGAAGRGLAEDRLALIPHRNVIGGAPIRQNVMQITVREMGSAYACER